MFKVFKFQVFEVIVLNFMGKIVQKMKFRFGFMKLLLEEEIICLVFIEVGVVKKVFRGKRVVFVDEVVFKKSVIKELEFQFEFEMEIFELLFVEIEFKNLVLYKEFFGFLNSIMKEE